VSGCSTREGCWLTVSEQAHELPRHVAVIMDGNGRWAHERGLDRIEGHYEGRRALRRFVEAAVERGIEVTSVYAFSSENWSRPKREVEALMDLMEEAMRAELEDLCKNNVRLLASGRLHELPQGLQNALARGREATASNDGMVLNLCINYGGRAEIVDAARAIAAEVKSGKLAVENIDQGAVAAHLYAPELPDPDLLIRPGGELRVSNFLLWEIAYAEFYVMPVYWPDFTAEHLDEAIADFQRRQRRFGGRVHIIE